MSALEKMIGANTEQYLSKIYNQTKKEIKSSMDLRKDSKYAKKLEVFLNQIKYLQTQYANTGNIDIDSNFPFADFWNKAEQIAMMQYLYNLRPEIFSEGTFINTFKGAENQAYLLGNSLEVGVSRIIFGIAAKASNLAPTIQNYETIKTTVGLTKTGDLRTQVPDIEKIGTDFIKNYYTKCYNEVGKNLKNYQNKGKENEITEEVKDKFITMPSVSGKIDNIGLSSEFVLGVNVTGMDKDLVLALENATFTDKNYTSTSSLNLGQTNPFRVFSTIAPEGAQTVDRYYRMINCFTSHESSHNMAPIYFYRLRAIYELTGVGMQYTEKSLGKNVVKELLQGQFAKFLIWNTPGGGLRVIPTKKIVDKIENAALLALPDNWQDALYGSIALPQNFLQEL